MATALVSLRHGTFPTWFGWASAALGLLLLTPYGYIGLYLAPAWLSVVSVWGFPRQKTEAMPVAPAR